MATGGEGGATAKTTTSSYSGGAGGKFRKKPFRRPTTPYDRPPTALRGNGNNGSWLTKLVVEPASKLISYGAHRLFASIFRKRLPQPPPHASELNHGLSDGLAEAVPNSQYGAQESAGGYRSRPTHTYSSNGISELEELLKQKTFTRSEIDHLKELLQSRAGEVSLGDDTKRNEETASAFERHQQFASSPLVENRNERDRTHGVMSTPIFNSKVLEDDIASPAELAKAYMESRPSKVSPSMLGMRSQVSREDISNMRFATRSPIKSLTTRTSISLGAPENGFITPRSRGRSAIYNMSRSRVHPTSALKGSGLKNNGSVGLTMTSASLSLVEHDERVEAKSMTLKRRSSVLDDEEVGSVGPIRRIRQKSNLIATRIPHAAVGVGIDADAVLVSSKQKLPLIDEPKQVSRTVEENVGNSIPRRNHPHVPFKSSEVAARILQHLEKLTPKEKSSEFKEKSPFQLTPSMLRGQALRSMEDVGSSKLLVDVQDDCKLEIRSNAALPDARGSTSQEQGKVEENGPKKFSVPSDTCYPLRSNDSTVSMKASWFSTGTSDAFVESVVSQPLQKNRAFRISAQEDSLELDDDLNDNEPASRSFFGGRGPVGTHLTDNKLSPAEQPEHETTFQPEVKSLLGLVPNKTTELMSPGAVMVGEGSSGIAFPALGATDAVVPPSVAAPDKPKEADNPPLLFTFNSKVADKVPSLPSESSDIVPETKPESSSSLVDVFAPAESEKVCHLNPLKARDRNGKSDNVLSAESNGQLVSSPAAGSFAAASSYDANWASTGGPHRFTPSTAIGNFVPAGTATSTSATSSGSMFGSAATPSVLGGPVFKFGASVELSTAVSAASNAISPPGGDLKTKAEADPSSSTTSSSCSTGVVFGAAISGNNTFGLSSSDSYSTASLQDSLFGSASKSFVSGVGSVSQGTSVQSVPSASSSSFNLSTSTSFVSSLSDSQILNPNTDFGFSSSASSSHNTGAYVPCSGPPTSNVVAFSVSSTATSDGISVSSSSGAAPSMFSFGFGSSSSSINSVGLTGGTTTPSFSFGGSSLVSASVISTASSFSSGTSGIFNFGGSSPASSTVNSVSSNSAPNVFSSSWQSPKSSVFDSTVTSASPSTGFSFGASSISSAPTNAAPIVFNSSTGPSSSRFSFATSSASVLSSLSPSISQPMFDNAPSGFAVSPGNNDQMNTEDSMAEDPVQSTTTSVPVFGQPAVSPSPTGFMFGSTVPSQANPFQFGGLQNQAAPQNHPSFQASSSLEFNAGGSFSLGSGGGDKSGRKFVKINRSKNRKK